MKSDSDTDVNIKNTPSSKHSHIAAGSVAHQMHMWAHSCCWCRREQWMLLSITRPIAVILWSPPHSPLLCRLQIGC